MQGVKESGQLDRFLFNVYVLILVVLPWPYGSNRDWAWPVIGIVVCLLALFLIWSRPSVSASIKILLTCLCFLVGWMTLQGFGIPFLLEPISIDFKSTRDDLLKTVIYASFVYCSYHLINSRLRIETVVFAIVFVALAQACIGILQVFYLDAVQATGSFPNRNHLAAYLVIALALGLGLMVARMQDGSGSLFDDLVDMVSGPQARLRLILVVLVVAVVLTRSRGGNLVLMLSVFVAGGCFMFAMRTVSKKVLVLLVSLILLDLTIIGGYFGVDRIAERIRDTTLQTESRDELNRYSLAIAGDHLLLGTGAGTFEHAFAKYRGTDISARVTNAENDYLEFLVELGVIGVFPLIIVIALCLWRQWSNLAGGDRFNRGIAFGCLMGTSAMLMHSTVEFNLQIPAITFLFLILLTLPFCDRTLETS